MHSLAYGFVWLLVFVIPWEMLGQFGPLPTLSKFLGLGAAGFAVLALLMGMRIRPWPRALIGMMAYWLWSVLSFAWSVDPSATSTHVITLTQLVILVCLMWQFAPRLRQQIGLMYALILGLLVPLGMMYTSFRDTMGAEESESLRYSGAGHDANYLAELFVVAIFMALYLALRPNLRGTWVRVFHWGFILAASVGVMLTGSRAGALALVVATVWTLFVLGVIQRGRFFSTKIPVVMAVLAGALFIALLVPTGLLERIAEIKSVPDTFVLRWTAWWKGAEAWMGSPILGVGGGAFAEAIVRLGAEKRMVSHNILVTVTVEKGIVGILLFLWFAWTLLRDMRFLPRSERLLWQGVSLAWFLCSLSAGSGADKLSWFVFGMVLVQTRLFRHAASMSRGKAVTLPAINRTSPNLRGAQ